jgi:hypothetical protein
MTMHAPKERPRKARGIDLYVDPSERHSFAYDAATGRALTDEDLPKYDAWIRRPLWMFFIDFLLGKPRAPY